MIVVSGIMAAGKSTVSQLLAERFQYGVHLRGDVFRRMIVSGQASMADDSAAAQRQLQLRYRLACQAADGYATPVSPWSSQDVVIGELLREFLDGDPDPAAVPRRTDAAPRGHLEPARRGAPSGRRARLRVARVQPAPRALAGQLRSVRG